MDSVSKEPLVSITLSKNFNCNVSSPGMETIATGLALDELAEDEIYLWKVCSDGDSVLETTLDKYNKKWKAKIRKISIFFKSYKLIKSFAFLPCSFLFYTACMIYIYSSPLESCHQGHFKSCTKYMRQSGNVSI